jgi:hypothetical protein
MVAAAGITIILALVGCGHQNGGATEAAQDPVAQISVPPGAPTSIVQKMYAGIPSVMPSRTRNDTSPIVVIEGDQLYLSVWGSGSCPSVPVSLVVLSRSKISIAIDNRYRDPNPRPNVYFVCTDDLRGTTSVVAIDPRKLDLGHRVTVNIHSPDDAKIKFPPVNVTATVRP